MKHLTNIIACVMTLLSQAQDWAPLGTTWHYPWLINSGPLYPPDSGYYRFESLLDTVISGQATRKVDAQVPTNVGPFYTHDVDGVVFIYVPSTELFDTLFNFNAVPGDRWSYVPMPSPLACTDESWVQVVDTGRTVVDGLSLRWLAVDNHNVLEDFEYVVPDTIIERLGPKNSFLLPHEQCNTAVSPGVIGVLLCYEDVDIDYIRPGIVDCTLGMAVSNLSNDGGPGIFPNPGDQAFELILQPGTSGMITVHDARGSLVLGPVLGYQGTRLNATSWPTGLYTVRLTPGVGLPSARRWMKL